MSHTFELFRTNYTVKYAPEVDMAAERAEAVAMLRQICAVYGDNDWPDDLHLSDVLEKHLWRHLEAKGSQT